MESSLNWRESKGSCPFHNESASTLWEPHFLSHGLRFCSCSIREGQTRSSLWSLLILHLLWFCSNRPQELTKVNPSPCGNHKRINRNNYPCWLGCLTWKHFSDSRVSNRLSTSNSISWHTLLKKPWTDLLESLRICDWVRQKATVHSFIYLV